MEYARYNDVKDDDIVIANTYPALPVRVVNKRNDRLGLEIHQKFMEKPIVRYVTAEEFNKLNYFKED